MHNLVTTQYLELILNKSVEPNVHLAIAELIRLKEVQAHLLHHLRTIKAQSDSSATRLRALIS